MYDVILQGEKRCCRGQAQAQQGALGALVGSSTATFKSIQPVLLSFCSAVQHFGGVGAGGRAKLINNAMVIGFAAMVIEAFRKARTTQTDWSQLYDVVRRGSADSGVLHRIVGHAVSEGNYRGYAFTVANAFKDMAYIVEMDERLGLQHSAINSVVMGIFRRAVEEDGLGDLLISELLALEAPPQIAPVPGVSKL